MTTQPTPHSIAYGKMLEREMAKREAYKLAQIEALDQEIKDEQERDRIIREGGTP